MIVSRNICPPSTSKEFFNRLLAVRFPEKRMRAPHIGSAFKGFHCMDLAIATALEKNADSLDIRIVLASGVSWLFHETCPLAFRRGQCIDGFVSNSGWNANEVIRHAVMYGDPKFV
jgi:hypothetical protein